MGGVKGTRYLLKIRNHAPRATHHAPRKAENSVPPLFFEKAGDKKKHTGANRGVNQILNKITKSVDADEMRFLTGGADINERCKTS